MPRSMSDSCLVESQYQQRMMAQGHSPNHSPMEGDVDYSLINSMLKLLHFEKVRQWRSHRSPPVLVQNILRALDRCSRLWPRLLETARVSVGHHVPL